MASHPRRRHRLASDHARRHREGRCGTSVQSDTSPWIYLGLESYFIGDPRSRRDSRTSTIALCRSLALDSSRGRA
eukprot:6737452-Alexandrium_andersonii.AAC.1